MLVYFNSSWCHLVHATKAVKRETGVNPVRSRHCKRGAWRMNATGRPAGKAAPCGEPQARKPAVRKRRDPWIPDHGELVMPRLVSDLLNLLFSLGKGRFLCRPSRV